MSPSARQLVRPGEHVRIHRKGYRRWEGLFTVIRTMQRSVWVTDGNKVKFFPVTAVLPVQSSPRDDGHVWLFRNFISDEKGNVSWMEFVEEFNSSTNCILLTTEEVPPYRGSCSSAYMHRVRRRGVEMANFELGLPPDCQKGPPSEREVLRGQLMRLMKNIGTNSERYKALLVVQGHRDSETSALPHDSATLRNALLRNMLSVASTSLLNVWSFDINKA